MDNKYRTNLEYEFEASTLSAANDPHGFNKDTVRNGRKQAEKENYLYEMSKPTLFGLLNSMCTKELDEKIAAHEAMIVKTFTTDDGEATNTYALGHLCPLLRWRTISYLVTTKSTGNKRLDENTVMVSFATIRLRTAETINDYYLRMRNILDSHAVLKIA